MYQYFDLLRVSKYIVGTDVLILICIYEVSKPLKNYKKLIEIHTRHRRNYDIHNIGTLKLCLLTDLRREDYSISVFRQKRVIYDNKGL